MEEAWQQCELGFNNARERSIILRFQLSEISPIYIQQKQVNFCQFNIAEIGNSFTVPSQIYPI